MPVYALSKRIIHASLFILGCIMTPIVRLCAFAAPRRGSCPAIGNKVLLASATELAQQIRSRQITSEEVIAAYVARCKEVNPLVNAIVEERFEEALREARELDSLLRSSSKGEEEIARDTPLLGVPVTVKESIAVGGLSHRVGRKMLGGGGPIRASTDAEVVRRVREAGAIILLVSNTPEMCMCWETFNNLTGTTYNPYDPRRTAGGSSGGEAALLAAGASVLSLASDIGGSARLPAMFCGVFGHKPTPRWVSTIGHRPDCADEKWSSFFTIGPMVRYAVDLPLLLRVMRETNEPVDHQVDLKRTKYFYMEDDGGSSITSAVHRDVKAAIRRLAAHIENRHGVPVESAHLPEMRCAFEISAAMLLKLDGVETIFSKASDPREWRSVSVELVKYVCCLSPHTFPNIAYGLLKKLADKLPESYYRRMEEKNAALKRRFEDMLGDNGVFIYPTFVSSAHYPYEIFPKIANVAYMMIFNSLGLPVTQCPMGFDTNGLPIGLQIVANPGKDHLAIAVALEIERAFGGWHQPTSPRPRPRPRLPCQRHDK